MRAVEDRPVERLHRRVPLRRWSVERGLESYDHLVHSRGKRCDELPARPLPKRGGRSSQSLPRRALQSAKIASALCAIVIIRLDAAFAM
jgi:hypothetical protein